MARYKIIISGKGIRQDQLLRLISNGVAPMYPQALVSIQKEELPTSRADRFADAKGMVENAKNEAESLRDELQDWFDNLPDQFQQGDKGSQLEEAISNLDQFISGCEEAEGTDVEFPGMY